MSEQLMNPREAADHIEDVYGGQMDPPSITTSALRVLVDHARATAAPGDLAALAETVTGVEANMRTNGDNICSFSARGMADALAPVAAALRAHRCAPAVEVATEDVAPMSPDDECTCGHDYATHVVNDGACLHAKVCACAGFDLAPSTPAAAPAEGEAASGDVVSVVDRILMVRQFVNDWSLTAAQRRDVCKWLSEIVAALRDASPAVEQS